MTDPQAERPTPETEQDETPTAAESAPEAAAEASEPAAEAEPAAEEATGEEPAAEAEPETAPVAAEAEVEEEAVAAPPPARGRRERAKRPRPAAKPAPGPARPTGPYAIIETGGKQYRVSVGDTLSVERLPAEAGSDLTIERVLLLGGDGGTRVGTPTVAGAAVTARVDDHFRGEKIVVFKYKAKKRYRRKIGHRQELTRLTITGIQG
jgi:large subunit ribosomal protein L21